MHPKHKSAEKYLVNQVPITGKALSLWDLSGNLKETLLLGKKWVKREGRDAFWRLNVETKKETAGNLDSCYTNED